MNTSNPCSFGQQLTDKKETFPCRGWGILDPDTCISSHSCIQPRQSVCLDRIDESLETTRVCSSEVKWDFRWKSKEEPHPTCHKQTACPCHGRQMCPKVLVKQTHRQPFHRIVLGLPCAYGIGRWPRLWECVSASIGWDPVGNHMLEHILVVSSQLLCLQQQHTWLVLDGVVQCPSYCLTGSQFFRIKIEWIWTENANKITCQFPSHSWNI